MKLCLRLATTASTVLALTLGTVAVPARGETLIDPTDSTNIAAPVLNASVTAPMATARMSPEPTKTKTESDSSTSSTSSATSSKQSISIGPSALSGGAKAKVSNYNRLTSRAKRVANTVRDNWGGIKFIGGWRAGSAYSGDHPAGRAIDVMIPNWSSNSALGYSIARYFANPSAAKKYGIAYVIFRQKIWTTQNPRWRSMENRGGATANHLDHVHISVR